MEDVQQFSTVVSPPFESHRLQFRIPRDWTEQPDSASLTMFYPEPGGGPWPIGGILFVSVKDTQPGPWSDAEIEELIRDRKQADDTFRRVGADHWIVYSQSRSDDVDPPCANHVWRLLLRLESLALAQVVFSYTAIALYYTKPDDLYYYVVEMLEREIAAAVVVAN